MSAAVSFTAILDPIGAWNRGPALFSKALGSVGKANPYKDAEGRFTTRARAAGPGGRVTISRVSGRVFAGREVPVKTKLNKLEVGVLGEQIAAAYVKGSKSLNVKVNNFAVDLMAGSRVIEVKAGLVSNGKSAQQWRATAGQPGVKESAWLAKASSEQKRLWNARKQERILQRKEDAIKVLAKKCRCKIETMTVASIVNPDTRTADVFVFGGFKLRTGWQTPEAKAAYVGTYRYSQVSKAWADLIEKFNPCHEASTGQFCSTEGGVGGAIAAVPKKPWQEDIDTGIDDPDYAYAYGMTERLEQDWSASDIERRSETKAKVVSDLSNRLRDNADFEALVAEVGSGSSQMELLFAAASFMPAPRTREQIVSSLIKSWAATSGDTNALSIAIQKAAANEFGTGKLSNRLQSSWNGETLGRRDALTKVMPGLQAFVRVQYDSTQAWFKERGINRVTVFRGMEVSSEWSMARSSKKYPIGLNPLSSFSLSRRTAVDFAGEKRGSVMLTGTIPVGRVLSVPVRGAGCLGEAELIVIGGRTKMSAGPVVDISLQARNKLAGFVTG